MHCNVFFLNFALKLGGSRGKEPTLSMDLGIKTSVKERIIGFVWQHLWLLVSLFVLASGVSLCVRSDLGSSVISSAPYAFTIAGEEGLAPGWSLGMYTNILNVLLVAGQIVVLRKKFQILQLLQLFVGIIFGVFIDMSMALTSSLTYDDLGAKLVLMITGSTLMALGVAMEIKCASITMPGEGLPAALSKLTGKPFANMKICVDISLVALALIASYMFFGRWMWNVVGVGTLFAMLYIGIAVKVISRHLGWFDRLLGYRPGFRRYLYGLARYLFQNKDKKSPNKLGLRQNEF